MILLLRKCGARWHLVPRIFIWGLVLTERRYAINMPIACITTVSSLSISLSLGSRLYGGLLAALKRSEFLDNGELR
jgi:hypothetical protein